MLDWWKLATRADVARRALLYAVAVGAVLIAINHGDALVTGRVDGTRLLKMALTTLVPYTVSTLSSVGAMRQAQARAGAGGERHPRRRIRRALKAPFKEKGDPGDFGG